jgi:phosphotransferase system enzyme I (PtsI)
MKGETSLVGMSASPGFASGSIYLAGHGTRGQYKRKKSTDAEFGHLSSSIEAAIAQTLALMQRASGDAADILEFQLAMLGDDTFPEAARPAIEAGAAADQAWSAVLEQEIANYAQSEEEYFRARTADLEDIRDRVLAHLRGDDEEIVPVGVIYVADDITPSIFLSHDWTNGGLALRKGSATSHVAMLARQRGIPMIVSVGPGAIDGESPALLDAAAGKLVLSPGDKAQQDYIRNRQTFDASARIVATYIDKPALTADGQAITLLVNIADPADTDSIAIAHVDGVGLMRTEFLYNHGLPDEDTQYHAYRKVLEWAGSKPVTIRTVDAGGDKPVPGFTEDEANPFLGVRGIRLCLAKPDVFAVQIRALLRAGVHGNLKVMLPMVSVPEELGTARAMFDLEFTKLRATGVACSIPEIGIMVEVPSVAITPQRFEQAAFFSIGSNDLTQYVMAASRDSGALADIARPDNPAVLSLIENVALYGAKSNKAVSLCGDAASDAAMVPLLISAGVTTLSVAASRIGAVKAAIAMVQMNRAGKTA